MKREELMINDMVFDYTNSPVNAFELGYAECVKQMHNEFNELLVACNFALQNQTKGEAAEITNQMKGDKYECS